ncbi:F-box/kelch-repeat protein At3g06240-like isoform X2 [Tripterygium wilfordii]|uniref:F-box/kelch-repeat protein At3g06240-like isoform X2 n=1 Tax=Tripterygium wilfordii TaxID=458696 RepID=UPI0018F82C27|nr:F-box/kelch-repeat protein At3g06240-like isoform X2 [Tripterygium wilfordii]
MAEDVEMLNMPEDVLIDILSWLPVKSLVRFSKIAIWNPSSREFKPLPLSPIKRAKHSAFGSCGFGFDRKTNDYKVLRIVTQYLNQRRCWVNQAEIYSLDADSWREIPTLEHLPQDIGDIPCFNTYHDGHYYWRAFRGRGGLILSFDFADEVFEVLPLPDPGEGISWNNYSWHLAIFNGCIAAVLYAWQDPEKCFDLWVMTERGVKDSWVKQARIGPISGVDRPLEFWRNGGLFLKNSRGQLVLYDPSTQQLKNLQLPGPQGRLQVVTYVESLVPINGRREDEDDLFVRTTIQNS